MRKKEIKEQITNKVYNFFDTNRFSNDIFEGSIDEVVDKLNAIKNNFKSYKDVVIENYCNYDDQYFEFYGIRDETVEEYNKRIEKENKKKEAKNKRIKEKLEKEIKKNPGIAAKIIKEIIENDE